MLLTLSRLDYIMKSFSSFKVMAFALSLSIYVIIFAVPQNLAAGHPEIVAELAAIMAREHKGEGE